jgi:hypothetical protein
VCVCVQVDHESELTPEYLRDLEGLKALLGRPDLVNAKTTGRGLVAMLRFLVQAANDQEDRNIFPQVNLAFRAAFHRRRC